MRNSDSIHDSSFLPYSCCYTHKWVSRIDFFDLQFLISCSNSSTPDFILSTYITPITHLAKQIQESEGNIDIQVMMKESRR